MINKLAILKEIPLFAELSRDEFKLIEEKSRVIEYKKGEVIYKQGQPPSAFYYVIMGRVAACSENQAVLEYLHRGKYFGIISLLTGDSHSVTTRAVNDCLILTIKDQDFSAILKRIPAISIDLSKTLSRRLKRKNLHEKTIFESTIVSVFSFYARAGKSLYALNLALSLKKETHKSVIMLEITPSGKSHSMPKKLEIKQGYPVFEAGGPSLDTKRLRDSILKDVSGLDLICLSYDPADENYLKILVNILNLFTNDYHFVMVDLPSSMERRKVFGTLNQSDLIHFLVKPKLWDMDRNRQLIEKLEKDYHFPSNKIKVIIQETKPAIITPDEERGLLKHNIFATLPEIGQPYSERLVLDEPESRYSKAIKRISRQEGDCQVGLALGVGVAYGFCHAGVLKVIEENNIPIDIICGSSMGALIASLWSIGKSSSEIIEVAKDFKEPKYIWELMDFTFPFLGFIKGNKIYRFLKKHLGNKTFYDTKIPLRIVASDVKRKETLVFDKGLLVDALMASCSMPGVFSPFTFKEGMLFDGGVINPLPTEPLFELGVRKIIAVNVTPSKEDLERGYAKIKSDIAGPEVREKRRLFSLKDYLRSKFKINILDIIFSSIEIMQSEIAIKEGQLADIVLHPDTSGLHWLELNKAEEFAKRGEQEARDKLDKILRVVNE
ncbi:MAG: patatin-like phospholipase family protein [Candidatus Omnitrophica bacterium]|nr:patatin-like phospholipase family protein [Candidatus Omnitrophota bacterium]